MDYGEILRGLGYNLVNRGNYWQCSALFRDGDNRTALKIYKNTGVWRDFVAGGKSQPFEALVKKTKSDYDISQISKNKVTYKKERELLKEEKIFPENCLKRLLPDYSFYNKRGISSDILKMYRGGIATNGKLFNRFVFPVKREDYKIHGFAGRQLIDNPSYPKWINYGKSTDWFYPYFSVSEVEDSIKKSKSIILLESIGDALALSQAGIFNVTVSFTNNISSKLCSRLAVSGKDIIIGFNNDFRGNVNRGLVGAVTALLKLNKSIDINKLWVMPPFEKNIKDFGDMETVDVIKHFKISYSKDEQRQQLKTLIEGSEDLNIPKSLIGDLKKFKKEFEFNYE